MSHLTPPSEADSPGVRGPKACVTCARAKVKCIFDAEAIICTRFVRGRLIRIRLLIVFLQMSTSQETMCRTRARFSSAKNKGSLVSGPVQAECLLLPSLSFQGFPFLKPLRDGLTGKQPCSEDRT